jgi:SAM-dependent methyltransferase
VLDVGFLGESATPFLHEAVINRFPKATICGLDVNPKMASFAANKSGTYYSMSLFDADEHPELINSFDAIIFCEVFEHLPHPYLALHKIYSCLRTGGKLIMTWPNPLNFRLFLKYLFQKDIAAPEYLQKHFGAPDHLVFPMPTSMARYASKLGFKVESVKFLKGASLPIINKFSPYVGLVAQKTVINTCM